MAKDKRKFPLHRKLLRQLRENAVKTWDKFKYFITWLRVMSLKKFLFETGFEQECIRRIVKLHTRYITSERYWYRKELMNRDRYVCGVASNLRTRMI